jgi:hypothetical protein
MTPEVVGDERDWDHEGVPDIGMPNEALYRLHPWQFEIELVNGDSARLVYRRPADWLAHLTSEPLRSSFRRLDGSSPWVRTHDVRRDPEVVDSYLLDQKGDFGQLVFPVLGHSQIVDRVSGYPAWLPVVKPTTGVAPLEFGGRALIPPKAELIS